MTPEEWENLVKRGKLAVQGAALKLATDAVEWLEEWQKPKGLRYRGDLLTEDEYKAMLELQKGVCAICGKKPKVGRLAVDHIHGTDRVRGLLCNLCNPALGLFKDDPHRLRAAIEYLEHGLAGTVPAAGDKKGGAPRLGDPYVPGWRRSDDGHVDRVV